MDKQERKRLLKYLTEKKKELKYKIVCIEKSTILKRPKVDEKYVTQDNYKELVILYDLMKEKPDLSIEEVEKLIEQNASKFPFNYKCFQSIYNFVSELRCNGPYFIAKEMSRLGKEIDTTNKK